MEIRNALGVAARIVNESQEKHDMELPISFAYDVKNPEARDMTIEIEGDVADTDLQTKSLSAANLVKAKLGQEGIEVDIESEFKDIVSSTIEQSEQIAASRGEGQEFQP